METTPLRCVFLVFLAVVLGAIPLQAQRPAEWHDSFADHLTGKWKVEGKVMGHDAHHEVDGEWVLDHQFVRLHERTSVSAPASESKYEAIWFWGYDSVSGHYVLHLLDVFGGRYSETLGYGVRSGNEIRFVFEYPDGPFHTTFRWLPETATWEWLMEQQDKGGKWTPFADLKFAPAPK